jgi:8-oxo-dGTP pyrophosphatase MutT (NUDIX family)
MWDPFAIQLWAHGRESWEFPRGNSKEGEDALQTAKREAEEETRLPVNADRVLGYTNQNTAYNLFNTPVVLTSVKYEAKGTDADSDLTEEIEDLVFKSPTEILSMIRAGNIICGHTVAAFAIYISNFPESICAPKG